MHFNYDLNSLRFSLQVMFKFTRRPSARIKMSAILVMAYGSLALKPTSFGVFRNGGMSKFPEIKCLQREVNGLTKIKGGKRGLE